MTAVPTLLLVQQTSDSQVKLFELEQKEVAHVKGNWTLMLDKMYNAYILHNANVLCLLKKWSCKLSATDLGCRPKSGRMHI